MTKYKCAHNAQDDDTTPCPVCHVEQPKQFDLLRKATLKECLRSAASVGGPTRKNKLLLAAAYVLNAKDANLEAMQNALAELDGRVFEQQREIERLRASVPRRIAERFNKLGTPMRDEEPETDLHAKQSTDVPVTVESSSNGSGEVNLDRAEAGTSAGHVQLDLMQRDLDTRVRAGCSITANDAQWAINEIRRLRTVQALRSESLHDCDEGFVCCDGCRHVGHVKDLPEDHAAPKPLITGVCEEGQHEFCGLYMGRHVEVKCDCSCHRKDG